MSVVVNLRAAGGATTVQTIPEPPVAPPGAPAAPTGLTVVSVTETTVTLDWNDSTDLRPGDKYQIFVDDVQWDEVTISNHLAEGGLPGTSYQFRVSAGQAGSYGPWSLPVTATTTPVTPAPVPVAPTGLSVVSVTQTSINLDWATSTDLRAGDKYQISVNGTWSGLESTTSQYTHTGLAAATAYAYRVGAGQAGSYGPFSSPVTGITASGTTPPPTYAITGTAYYVAANGSDSNNGTSTSTPWQTAQRAMSQNYTAGDGLLFRRGDTFYINRIDKTVTPKGSERWIIGAYGTGARPILTPVKICNNPASWTLHATNVWKINLSSSSTHTGWTGNNTNIGHLMINGTLYGAKKVSLSLTNNWDFYNDTTFLYVRATTNPTSLASDIRAAPDARIIQIQSRTEVADIEFSHSGGHAISSGSSPQNIRVLRCYIHHLGGSFLIGFNQNTDRYGNGVEAWAGSGDWIVSGNTIDHCYDTATSVQGPGGTTSNITFTDNDMTGSSQSFEMWKQGGNTWSNIKFEGNRCYDGGLGWSGPLQPNQDRRCHILVGAWESPGTNNNIFVRNNTITRGFRYIHSWPDFNMTGVVYTNNDIRLASGTQIQFARSHTINQGASYASTYNTEAGTTWTVL